MTNELKTKTCDEVMKELENEWKSKNGVEAPWRDCVKYFNTASLQNVETLLRAFVELSFDKAFKLGHAEGELIGFNNGEENIMKIKGFDLTKYSGIDKRKLLRNCVEPETGLHIFNMAFKDKQKTIMMLKEADKK